VHRRCYFLSATCSPSTVLFLPPVLQPQKSKGTKPGRSPPARAPTPSAATSRSAAASHLGGGGYGRLRCRLQAGSCSCTASTSGRDSGVRPRPGRRSRERQSPARGHAGDIPIEQDHPTPPTPLRRIRQGSKRRRATPGTWTGRLRASLAAAADEKQPRAPSRSSRGRNAWHGLWPSSRALPVKLARAGCGICS
jgi:hypothetical protein